jgi:hypothetical protein
MDISVKILKENKDGSAEAVINFDKEGLETLVQWGFVALLTKALDEYAVKPKKSSPVAIGKPKKRITRLLKDLKGS